MLLRQRSRILMSRSRYAFHYRHDGRTKRNIGKLEQKFIGTMKSIYGGAIIRLKFKQPPIIPPLRKFMAINPDIVLNAISISDRIHESTDCPLGFIIARISQISSSESQMRDSEQLIRIDSTRPSGNRSTLRGLFTQGGRIRPTQDAVCYSGQ